VHANNNPSSDNTSTPGFKSYSSDPIVLTMGRRGEWDAGALGTMSVIRVGALFHMYYEGWSELSETGGAAEYGTLRIGHATSADGVNWEKDTSNPIIPAGSTGEWDECGTWDPFVIHEDGVFKLWYGGNDQSNSCNWGFATSTDGSRLVKQGQFTSNGNYEDIHVVHSPDDGRYYLFHWDRSRAPWADVMNGPDPRPSGLFVAVSDDETGFDMAKARRIRIEGQQWPAKYSHVIRDNDRWVMVYGEAVTRGKPSRSGIATSTDLFHWTRRAFPVVDGHDAEILRVGDDEWYLYYGPLAHFDWPDCDIRLSTYRGSLSALYEATGGTEGKQGGERPQ
jgi:hypothetical protein